MKPFLDGKKDAGTSSIASAPAAILPPGTGIAVARRSHPTVHAPSGGHVIDVVKEGDRVVRLVVTCACGERMEIECIYPAG